MWLALSPHSQKDMGLTLANLSMWSLFHHVYVGLFWLFCFFPTVEKCACLNLVETLGCL